MNFSVLMSIYYKEKASYLKESLVSIFNQSLVPNEVVLVKDGSLGDELDFVIEEFADKFSAIKVVSLKENVGLAKALNFGLQHCSNELVARMDSDDICHPERFKFQINAFLNDEDLVICGTNLSEFNNKVGDMSSVRNVPSESADIYKFLKYRCPFNHPTIMYKKSKIISIGGYKHLALYEDYYLWYRIIQNKFKAMNINKSLVYGRVGNDMIGRRRGLSYFQSELVLLRIMYNDRFINIFQFYGLVVAKFFVRIIPKQLLKIVYSFLRISSNDESVSDKIYSTKSSEVQKNIPRAL